MEEDDGAPQPMDTQDTALYEFPEPNHVRVARDADGAYWKEQLESEPTFELRVLAAMLSNQAAENDMFTDLCHLPILMFAVHRSPVELMLQRKGRGAKKTPYIDTLTSVMSLTRMFSFYYEVLYVSFKPSEKGHKRVLHFAKEFYAQTKAAKIDLYDALDAACVAYKEDEDRETFLKTQVTLMQNFTLYYIHLLELFLFNVAVNPDKHGIALEHVLTPNEWIEWDQLSTQQRNMGYKMVKHFFSRKDSRQNQVHIKSGAKHLVQDWFDVKAFGERRQRHANALWSGWLDPETAHEYALFNDWNQRLTQ